MRTIPWIKKAVAMFCSPFQRPKKNQTKVPKFVALTIAAFHHKMIQTMVCLASLLLAFPIYCTYEAYEKHQLYKLHTEMCIDEAAFRLRLTLCFDSVCSIFQLQRNLDALIGSNKNGTFYKHTELRENPLPELLYQIKKFKKIDDKSQTTDSAYLCAKFVEEDLKMKSLDPNWTAHPDNMLLDSTMYKVCKSLSRRNLNFITSF